MTHKDSVQPSKLLHPASWTVWQKALFIAVLIFLIYGFGIGRGFMFDDIPYICNNPLLKRPDALKAAWFSADPINYYPLFWTFLRLEWLLFGNHAWGYHLVNLVVHTINALLVWRIAAKWRLPGAWWVGLIFAVHPINVQTLAWGAEQKNTWSFFFMALTLLAFTRHMERNDWRSLGVSLISFFAALACKTSVAGLPLFLVLCYGRQGKRWMGALRVLPFFLLSLGAGITTLWFEHTRLNAVSDLSLLPLSHRVLVAGDVFWGYLGKALWPVGLSPMYPGWGLENAVNISIMPLALLVLTIVLAVRYWRFLGGIAVMGLGYYLVMLLPFLGIFDTKYFEISLLADHWQYHALPGVIVAFLSLAKHAANSLPVLDILLKKGALVFTVLLALLASIHSAHFEDGLTMWRYILSKNPGSPLAWCNLGAEFVQIKEYSQALDAFRHSLQLKPEAERSRLLLADTLLEAKHYEEADRAFAYFEDHYSANPEAFNNHAFTLHHLKRDNEAIALWQRALELAPGMDSARTNLIKLFVETGQCSKAESFLNPQVMTDSKACQRIACSIVNASQLANGESKVSLIHFTRKACEMSSNNSAFCQALAPLTAR